MKNLKSKIILLILAVSLIGWLGGCGNTEENPHNKSTEIEKTDYDLYIEGCNQGHQYLQSENYKKELKRKHENHNKEMVNLLLSDKTFYNYYEQSGSPEIDYTSFEVHDAITSKYGITVNINKEYDQDEMRKVLIKQLGIYSCLREVE